VKFFLSALVLIGFGRVVAQPFPAINPDNIEIIRDEWGVPHIFAKTDAEAAYGLAWANAEDAFAEMQELMIIGKGHGGRIKGIEGAKADFFRHVIGADKIVNDKLHELPVEFLKYLDGYCQGINAFAAKHPEQKMAKSLFPVEVKDILTAYVVSLSFMTDAAGAMEKIYGGKLDNEKVPGIGSNAYAVNSQKTDDGSTLLCINPHMQMSGTFHFYEAHIKSEEGLNMYGAIFHGGTSIFMGNNEHLGWGLTWNYFKRGDIYKLQMNPRKKLEYRFDNEWKKLETRKVTLLVKIGRLRIPVRKKSYWSELGPVLNSQKDKKQFYAFRYPAFMDIKAPLQWYKMNKSENLDEFKEALNMMGIGLFNIVYADKEDNLFYVSYGQVPFREDSIANMKVVPGHDSRYMWKRLHTLEELPKEENPDCNYIFNTNNSPFFATCDENTRLKLELKDYLDERPGQNNRATVLHEFFESNDKVDFEAFQAIKFNNSYSPNSYLMRKMAPYFKMDVSNHPEIEDLLVLFQNWSGTADTNDFSSSAVLVIVDHIFREKKYNDRHFITDFDITEKEFIKAVQSARSWLIENYGTVYVPLRKIFVARKGNVEFTAPGFPDALAANYGERKDNKYVLKAGDTYTQFVKFKEEKVQEIRTLVPFGNSNHPESPYYVNQSGLFKSQKTKKAKMNKEELLQLPHKSYHPR
jgi:acyl-homoserine-lactone acylase